MSWSRAVSDNPNMVGPVHVRGPIWSFDWKLLKQLIEIFDVASVLEVGAGRSTQRFAEHGIPVTSLESNHRYMGRLARYFDSEEWGKHIRLAPYTYVNGLGEPDLGGQTAWSFGFVDGPSAKVCPIRTRLHTCDFVFARTPRMVMHNSGRPGEVETVRIMATRPGATVAQLKGLKTAVAFMTKYPEDIDKLLPEWQPEVIHG